MVTVPGVAGQTVDAAEGTLAGVGLSADLSHRHSGTVPSGDALGTKPAGGASATKGEVIVLYVSSGPAPVKMPDVIGVSQSMAIKKLAKDGLVAVVTQQQQAGATGNVTAQSPTAGAELGRGATATITVTSALPTVSVPLVTAQTEEQAVTAVSKLGLVIDFTTRAVTDLAKDRIVLGQSPVAGTSVAKGSTLTLTVGVYTKKP
jgi:beta-lactam-binding protein with PASTA domain